MDIMTAPFNVYSQVSWSTNNEILIHLFRLFIEEDDIWSLASASLVCRTWRRVISVAVQRFPRTNNNPVRDALARFSLAPRDPYRNTSPCTVLPTPLPFVGDTPTTFSLQNSLLGRLLGRGSFSRVYELGRILAWCIKIASGGLATDRRFSNTNHKEVTEFLKEDPEIASVNFYYYSSGEAAKLLTHRDIGVVLLAEFERLHLHAGYPLPSWETEPLYPRPYYFSSLANTAYYVMERLHGITMRTALREAKSLDDAPSESDLVIDFAPLVQRLLRYLNHLLLKHDSFHGDMKPENIMLVFEGETGYRLRLIDPIPKGEKMRMNTQVEHILTLPYNPGRFLDWRADLASLCLLLHELKFRERLFDRLRYTGIEVSENFPVTSITRQLVATCHNLFQVAEQGGALFTASYREQYIRLALRLKDHLGGAFQLRFPATFAQKLEHMRNIALGK